jgi:hypothetical protein
MTAKGTRQRLSLKDEEKSLLERKYHNHSRQIHPFRPERISMIAAEIEGSAHRRRTVGYVEDVRPRDTGGWRERLSAASG